jgi:hypothetical protein
VRARLPLSLLVVLLAACGGGSTVNDDVPRLERPRLAPVAFAPLPGGWHTAVAVVRRERGCPVSSEAIVTSWPPDRTNPRGPAGDMPHGGSMVSAHLLRARLDRDLRADYPPIRELPLRLPERTRTSLEGYDVPEYRVFGSGRHFILEVRAAIAEGRVRPGMLARAQAVVNRLRLPKWIARDC